MIMDIQYGCFGWVMLAVGRLVRIEKTRRQVEILQHVQLSWIWERGWRLAGSWRVGLRPIVSLLLADRTNGVAFVVVVCRVQKLPLTAYRKSYMRNRLVPKWMTLTFIYKSFKVTWSRESLRHIRHWISRKPLEIEAWFQRPAIGTGE